MKAWFIVFFIVFCGVICSGYPPSFLCYECEDAGSAAECDRRQKIDNCNGYDKMCQKMHFTTANGKTGELRGCTEIAACEETKRKCENGEEIQFKDNVLITDCAAVCCVTADGAEKPCNGACRTISVNMVLATVTTIFVLKFFEQ